MDKKRFAWLLQALKFGAVGVLNTLVDYAVYSLLVLLPFFKEYYLLAQLIGYTCGLVNSLGLNKRWTFKQKERLQRGQLVRFLVVNLLALGVSSLLLFLLREGLWMNLYGAKILATGGSLLVNFIGNKLWVFRGKGEETPKAGNK